MKNHGLRRFTNPWYGKYTIYYVFYFVLQYGLWFELYWEPVIWGRIYLLRPFNNRSRKSSLSQSSAVRADRDSSRLKGAKSMLI